MILFCKESRLMGLEHDYIYENDCIHIQLWVWTCLYIKLYKVNILRSSANVNSNNFNEQVHSQYIYYCCNIKNINSKN